jgi:hypothetical protein
MTGLRHLFFASVVFAGLGFATPALAATSTRVVITQDQAEVPESRIQLFDAETGVQVQPQDDDDEGALYLLDGGRYRVVVDGQTVREITVSGRGSETFRIGLPPTALSRSDPAFNPNEYAGPAPGRGAVDNSEYVTVLVDVFFGQTDVPQTGIGFQRNGPSGGAPEEFAGTTPDRHSMIGVNLSAGLENLRVSLHYSEGDASNSFDVMPTSGGAAGRVNGAPAPSGSSGIAAPFPTSGSTDVDFNRAGAIFDLGIYSGGAWTSNWIGESKLGDSAAATRLSLYAGYLRLERDYDALLASSGTSGGFLFQFGQDRRQELTDDFFLFGMNGRLVAPFGPGMVGHLTASAGGYYRDSSLASIERNIANFGPVSDQDFTIVIDDSDDGLGFRGEIGAGLEFAVSRDTSVFVGGSAEYLSSIGAIFNPSSGDQVFFDGLTTELRTGDAWSWQVGGGLLIRFEGKR